MEIRKLVLIAFMLSGMAALIYELAWIRPIQFIFGSTVYTTSIIFASFMGGLALGSFILSKYADKIKNLTRAYALMELGIGLYGVLLLSIFNLLPKLYRVIYPIHESFYVFEFSQFLITFIVLLIPTTLMGATFPIIVRFYTKNKIGKGVGEIYSVNNIGAILGVLLAGFLLIPVLGIKLSIIIAGSINILIASVILLTSPKRGATKIIAISLILFLILAGVGNYNINKLYSGGFTRTQFSEELLENTEFLYYKEGLHATVSVTKDPLEGARVLLINGKGQGSTAFQDLRVNMLLAYLPILYGPESKNALVIGLGTGTTSGHLSQYMDVKTIEIEPVVIEASKFFNDINLDVLKNKNHTLIIADGRNYLLKDKGEYDIIVPEPSDPWQSFSTALFSKEFLELGKAHLSKDGIYLQWVPIYELNVKEFKSFYNTFNSVFPYIIVFANIREDEEIPINIKTSELIFIGSKEKLITEEIKKNFKLVSTESKNYLSAVKLDSAEDIKNLILFTNKELEGYGENYAFVTDDNMKLEFSTSKKVLNQNPEEVILDIKKFLEKDGE